MVSLIAPVLEVQIMFKDSRITPTLAGNETNLPLTRVGCFAHYQAVLSITINLKPSPHQPPNIMCERD